MSEQMGILRVYMLGREDVTYDDKPVLLGRNNATKASKLLLLLLHCGEEGISRTKLLEDLYGREDIVDAANNLRVTVHRLKKLLAEAGLPQHDYIQSSEGVYRWVAPIPVEIDAIKFRQLVKQAEEEQDEDAKAALLVEACEMYQGEFLPRLSGEEWVILESAQYKKEYFKALEWVSSYLKEHREYEKVLELVDVACRLYPFDEWQAEKIACYIELGRYDEAMAEYERTAKLLFDELGVTPSKVMLRQFDMMSERISNKPQILHEIKEGLQEAEDVDEGAFYCTAPSFRDAYRMMKRSMERNGQSVYIMLCTITDGHGNCMKESDKLKQMSDALFVAIKSSLRRCDSFTKYNPAQFLIMLTGINEENCKIVEERIMEAYAEEHKAWAKKLTFNVSSLYECTLK